MTERSGKNLSNDRIGDPLTGQLSSVQEVWGRGQTWRLTQMWYRQAFFNNALGLKVGRMGVNEDFNSFPCDFQSLAFCAAPIGNVAGDVWYSGPVSQWAARIKYNFDEQWAFQIGVLEQNPPNLETGNGFKLSGSGAKGALVPVELIWKPAVSVQALPGEYRLGYYHSSASAEDVYQDIDSRPHGVTGLAFKSRSSKSGWWVMGRQQLTAREATPPVASMLSPISRSMIKTPAASIVFRISGLSTAACLTRTSHNYLLSAPYAYPTCDESQPGTVGAATKGKRASCRPERPTPGTA